MSRPESPPLIEVEDLVVSYPAGRARRVQAVSGVSLAIASGETLGLVGESGCGKSTLARAILRLVRAEHGRVLLAGDDPLDERRLRRRVQMIFQDPVSSLNPARRVADIVAEGLEIWGTDAGGSGGRSEIVERVLHAVGLDPETFGARRPHELSGGQAQRVCLARALAIRPEMLVLDEPVSALDVSVQAQILNLLERLKAEFGLTMLFVSHDLSVVRAISDRVLVMYLGRVCEVAPVDELFRRARHPYTRALMASVPGKPFGVPPASRLIEGEPPSPIDPPSGCRFRTRCPRADQRCADVAPDAIAVGEGHLVACHHPVDPEESHDDRAR